MAKLLDISKSSLHLKMEKAGLIFRSPNTGKYIPTGFGDRKSESKIWELKDNKGKIKNLDWDGEEVLWLLDSINK